MRNPSSFSRSVLCGMLVSASILGVGCGGGPRYGAAGKRNKKCDCPTWNAVPAQVSDGTMCMNDQPRCEENARHN